MLHPHAAAAAAAQCTVYIVAAVRCIARLNTWLCYGQNLRQTDLLGLLLRRQLLGSAICSRTILCRWLLCILGGTARSLLCRHPLLCSARGFFSQLYSARLG